MTRQRTNQPLTPDELGVLERLGERLRSLPTRVEFGHSPPPEYELTLTSSEEIAQWLIPEMEDLPQEQMRALLLDNRCRLQQMVLVYQGGFDSIGDIRAADVFRDAVADGVPSVVLVHSHPSGGATPSEADVRTTDALGRAGALLGVSLLDHVILGRDGWVSLAREGLYVPPWRRARQRHHIGRLVGAIARIAGGFRKVVYRAKERS